MHERGDCPQGIAIPNVAVRSARSTRMHSDKQALAQLRGAAKAYGALRALDGVDLELHGGELLALLGPNGAGKTTAIGLLLGLLRADAGEVRLFGMDPHRIEARRHI